MNPSQIFAWLYQVSWDCLLPGRRLPPLKWAVVMLAGCAQPRPTTQQDMPTVVHGPSGQQERYRIGYDDPPPAPWFGTLTLEALSDSDFRVVGVAVGPPDVSPAEPLGWSRLNDLRWVASPGVGSELKELLLSLPPGYLLEFRSPADRWLALEFFSGKRYVAGLRVQKPHRPYCIEIPPFGSVACRGRELSRVIQDLLAARASAVGGSE